MRRGSNQVPATLPEQGFAGQVETMAKEGLSLLLVIATRIGARYFMRANLAVTRPTVPSLGPPQLTSVAAKTLIIRVGLHNRKELYTKLNMTWIGLRPWVGSRERYKNGTMERDET